MKTDLRNASSKLNAARDMHGLARNSLVYTCRTIQDSYNSLSEYKRVRSAMVEHLEEPLF